MTSSFFIRVGSLRGYLRAILWRGAILAVIVLAGLAALRVGVGFSERDGVTEAGVATQLYYTLGLFVLGGLDLGTPTGGPGWARLGLWLVYFAAPAVTTASVVEGLWIAAAPARWRIRRLRGHIVVAGCGRLGRLYLKRLRQLKRFTPVLMVDLKPNHPAAAEIRDVYRAQLMVGDVREAAVREALRLEHAERIFLFTGDDFVNLDTATAILSRDPGLASRMVVHVSNLSFSRRIAGTRVARECSIINKYHVAAAQLVRTALLDYFQQTRLRDVVVLAGFGRFGQVVLDELQRAARGTFARVVIIDTCASQGAAMFEQQIGFADFYERQIIDGDLHNPRVWESIEGTEDVPPVFIIGSGDDGANVSTGLWVKKQFPGAPVIVRNFYCSSFALEVSREAGISIFGIADLVESSMPDVWFGPATAAERRGRRATRPSGPRARSAG